MPALRAGEELAPEALTQWLGEARFKRVDSVEEPGDFAVRGGIVDILTRGATVETETGARETRPACGVRLDYFGDEIESIHEIDTETMGSDRRLAGVELFATGAATEGDVSGEALVSLFEYAHRDDVAVIRDLNEVTEQGRAYHDRAIDGSGIFGVPAVMRTVRERTSCVITVNEIGGSSDDRAVSLPVGKLREFSKGRGRGAERARGDGGRITGDRRVPERGGDRATG